MSLDLKGMTREQAVDHSIAHFQEIIDLYEEAGNILYNEFGFRYGLHHFFTKYKVIAGYHLTVNDNSSQRKVITQFLNKYPKFAKLDALTYYKINDMRTRVINLEKVKSADKKGYLESLTLIRNPNDGFLDVDISQHRKLTSQPEVKKLNAKGEVNSNPDMSVRNRLAMLSGLKSQPASQPASEPASPQAESQPASEPVSPHLASVSQLTFKPKETLPSGWFSAENSLGRTYYWRPENGSVTWNKPPAETLPSGWFSAENSLGRRYYWRPENGSVTWNKPSETQGGRMKTKKHKRKNKKNKSRRNKH